MTPVTHTSDNQASGPCAYHIIGPEVESRPYSLGLSEDISVLLKR